MDESSDCASSSMAIAAAPINAVAPFSSQATPRSKPTDGDDHDLAGVLAAASRMSMGPATVNARSCADAMYVRPTQHYGGLYECSVAAATTAEAGIGDGAPPTVTTTISFGSSSVVYTSNTVGVGVPGFPGFPDHWRGEEGSVRRKEGRNRGSISKKKKASKSCAARKHLRKRGKMKKAVSKAAIKQSGGDGAVPSSDIATGTQLKRYQIILQRKEALQRCIERNQRKKEMTSICGKMNSITFSS